MLGYEEKLERIELIDAVCDAGRLAKGLDQLLESLAHADQLDPLDAEGILALRSISEKCAARIGDVARILEAQNKILYAEERTNAKPCGNHIPPQLLVGWARDAACGTRHPCASESSWGERGPPRSSCAGCA